MDEVRGWFACLWSKINFFSSCVCVRLCESDYWERSNVLAAELRERRARRLIAYSTRRRLQAAILTEFAYYTIWDDLIQHTRIDVCGYVAGDFSRNALAAGVRFECGWIYMLSSALLCHYTLSTHSHIHTNAQHERAQVNWKN